MVKLLVLSDLHVEFAPFVPDREAVESADVVVLAGDIHKGVQGIAWARSAFADKQIVYVAGNHEFYGQYWGKLLGELHEAARRQEVHLLEDEAVEIGGVRFLGLSLWTDFELFGGAEQKSAAMRHARSFMNDFRLIKVDRIPEHYWVHSWRLVPELTTRRHRTSVQWLEQALSAADPARTVVVTHHAPHPLSVPERFSQDPLTPAFASDLIALMGRSALWVHGHMHYSADYVVGGTRVVCNPRGYPLGSGAFENDAFEPGFVIEV